MQEVYLQSPPTPARSWFPMPDLRLLQATGQGCLLVPWCPPNLAGGACPVPEGGSRIWPSLAALGPCPAMAWPSGPQEYGVLTYWVLCTGLCQEHFLCTEVLLWPAVPQTSAGRDSKQERSEGKRGKKYPNDKTKRDVVC